MKNSRPLSGGTHEHSDIRGYFLEAFVNPYISRFHTLQGTAVEKGGKQGATRTTMMSFFHPDLPQGLEPQRGAKNHEFFPNLLSRINFSKIYSTKQEYSLLNTSISYHLFTNKAVSVHHFATIQYENLNSRQLPLYLRYDWPPSQVA